MLEEFLRIAKFLNDKLNLTPLLYGSLGLEILIKEDLSPQDIDFLIPEIFIKGKWVILKTLIEDIGYHLVDLHEHEFFNGEYQIAFAEIEGLEKDINVRPNQIKTHQKSGVTYKLLNLEQYLLAYEYSSKDGYRRNKNDNKEFAKIDKIKSRLSIIGES
ncbi:hypothetical protein [Spirochaeta cellobiosiphila]|uniref:hypothetical protein n=1 Tax=Spirochaeta cellobiosiphila TaxID=504483 RepID=UPI000404034D|nr:hypothetical protein [Spirochaeta cellobiosiphila]